MILICSNISDGNSHLTGSSQAPNGKQLKSAQPTSPPVSDSISKKQQGK